MSSPQMVKDTAVPAAATVDLKLEVVVLPVADVDRSKRFYEGLGWRWNRLRRRSDFRAVQMTPPGSACSIHFGKGITTAEPGSVRNLYLAVSDMAAARAELIRRGADVSEPFHFASIGGRRSRAPTPRAAPTAPMPRSAIPTATAGCSRRSRRGFPAGDSAAWTSRP